jgi:hypothetical protein
MEPRPLLEEDPTEVELALLRAARGDGPRKEAAERALATIQGLLPTAGLPGPSDGGASGFPDVGAAAAVGHAGLVRWAKIVVVALGLGGAAAVTYQLTRPRAVVPPAPPLVPQTMPVTAPAEVPASPEIREDFAASREEERTWVRRTTSSSRARDESTRSLDRSLGQETRLLDRARQGLDAHRASDVLRLLDEHQRRFPHGRLRPEAMVLRVAALLQAGRIDAADSLASQLLADETYQTYAPRIRSLLREARR